MTIPDVLSVSELREHLAEAMTQVRSATAKPVFVGRHRRAEVVLPSADRYAQLVAEERRAAAAGAISSVRAEGLELDEFGESIMQDVAAGALTPHEAQAQILAQPPRRLH